MITTIAFDLDDTLLDTTGLLAPKAAFDAFEILIQAGLKLSHDQCEKLRIDLIKQMSHRDVFEKLANEYGNSETQKMIKKAIDTFYEPEFPTTLPLLTGARENIDYLKSKYRLYLVTAGTESAQIRKAKALGIEKDFIKIYVVDSLKKLRKKNAFLDILNNEKILPDQLLCIGNSVNSEIKDAIEINAKSCYFEFGEERGSLDATLKPDYHVKSHSEIITICKL